MRRLRGAAGGDAPVDGRRFLAALQDCLFPSRDSELLEYWEFLVVFEASSRLLLPPKYALITLEEINGRPRLLPAAVSNRRWYDNCVSKCVVPWLS